MAQKDAGSAAAIGGLLGKLTAYVVVTGFVMGLYGIAASFVSWEWVNPIQTRDQRTGAVLVFYLLVAFGELDDWREHRKLRLESQSAGEAA